MDPAAETSSDPIHTSLPKDTYPDRDSKNRRPGRRSFHDSTGCAPPACCRVMVPPGTMRTVRMPSSANRGENAVNLRSVSYHGAAGLARTGPAAGGCREEGGVTLRTSLRALHRPRQSTSALLFFAWAASRAVSPLASAHRPQLAVQGCGGPATQPNNDRPRVRRVRKKNSNRSGSGLPLLECGMCGMRRDAAHENW
jgi:hypothetical protein